MDVVELAQALIPASGVDWAAIARGGPAEREFRERVGPIVHPRFETVWPQHGPEAEVSAGLDETLAGLRRIGGIFERLVAVPQLYVDLGDRVLVLLCREGRMANGYEFAEDGAAIYAFEDGQIRRLQLYADVASGLKAAGISRAEAEQRGLSASRLADRAGRAIPGAEGELPPQA